MSAARDRVIALCRRGFAPVGVSSLVRPRETYPPHPEAQRELERFLERSAQHFGPTDTVLEALFVDAVDVGVMRAAVVFEKGAPEGLVRLDAREALRTFDGFEAPDDTVAPAEVVRVESVVDAWERAPVSPAVLWRWRHLYFGADVADHVLLPLVRHLRGRCELLLRPLLGRVLAAQGIRHALGSCRFADLNEPEAGGATPAAVAGRPRALRPAAERRPRGGRPPDSSEYIPRGEMPRAHALLLGWQQELKTIKEMRRLIKTAFAMPQEPSGATVGRWLREARARGPKT